MKLLNVGCGSHFHPNWINIDLVAHAPDVIPYDLRKGLPYDDESIDVVYHSHLLEHLDLHRGRSFLHECFRVLKPGGILRVAVPDLETIARHYILALENSVDNSCDALANHRWMTLELLDQMVRTRSGGEMAQFVADPHLPNKSFVQTRVGTEPFPIERRTKKRKQKGAGYRLRKLGKRIARLRLWLATVAVYLFSGKHGYMAWREGLFRQSGEVHRWMYDRISLERLLTEVGFKDVVRRTAEESYVDRFTSYGLDTIDGHSRKPDSLYMEAIKPKGERRQLDRVAA